MKEVKIKSESGVVSATLFEVVKADRVLIIASATGVKQSYYQKFAQFIADSGITVITFDYTGIGRSLKGPIKALQNNAADWGRYDLESVIQYIVSHYPNARKTVLGHSIGGQLVGLAKSSTQLDKLILVAAQSGYWKYWKGMGRMKMWFNWYVLFPTVISLFGFMNSKKISGMENLPKRVARQWSGWGKKPEYLFSDEGIDLGGYDKITTDLTAFSIDDDDFAPRAAVDWMTGKYRNAIRKSIHLTPADFQASKIGHFGIFKERFGETLWKKLLEEIE